MIRKVDLFISFPSGFRRVVFGTMMHALFVRTFTHLDRGIRHWVGVCIKKCMC